MATIKQSNPKAFEVLAQGLGELDGVIGRAGWFETSKYEDGTPTAYIAAIQEFGAVINHPGGTPYEVSSKGARFVSKTADHASSLPKTAPHDIIIPPRPFMRPTMTKQKRAWLNLLGKGAQAVIEGKTTALVVLESVAMKAAGDVAKTIAELTTPPLAKSTIAKRRRQMKNKKLVGALDKPLIATGQMFRDVTGKAEKI